MNTAPQGAPRAAADLRGGSQTIQGKFILGYNIYDRRWIEGLIEYMSTNVFFLRGEVISRYGQDAWERFMKDVHSEMEIEPERFHREVVNLVYKYARQTKHEVDSTVSTGPSNPPSLTPSHALKPQEYVPFTFMTHNLEKYGKSTGNKEDKVEEISEVVTTFNPDVLSTQEVTNPELFLGDMRDQVQDYELLPGPHYKSNNYNENYTGMFNTATIHHKPELFYIDPKTKKIKPYTKTLYFGKEAAKRNRNKKLKQARPTTLWEFRIPADRYNLRPPQKYFSGRKAREEYARLHVNLKHRRSKPYQTIRLINVHTSPGKSTPTIHQQVNDIVRDHKRLLKQHPNTLSLGDFYMQKGSKTNWKRLEKGTSRLKSLHPNVNTNFKKGEGKQVADHSVIPLTWKRSESFAIPPLPKGVGRGMESMMSKRKRGRKEKELSKWEESNIDHAPVFGFSQVPTHNPQQVLMEQLLRYFVGIYRQNNCLIQAIAGAAGVRLSQQVITAIRNELHNSYGVAIGDFIEANDENVEVIMRRLNLYGTVHIYNVENLDHATLPITIAYAPGRRHVTISINYSTYHFWASPRR